MDIIKILYYFVIGSIAGNYIKKMYYILLDIENKDENFYLVSSGIYLSIISNSFFKDMNIYLLFICNLVILFLLKKISYISAKHALSIALVGTLYVKYVYSILEICRLRIDNIIISGIVILIGLIMLLKLDTKKIT